jgi:putative oxidoreductase
MNSSQPRPIIPAVAPLYRSFVPYAYALIRAATGAILIPHGVQKLFLGGVAGLAARTLGPWGLPAPLAWAYGVGVLEFAGGILLVLGLLTRPVALLVAIEMLVAALGVHAHIGWAWNKGGAQYPVFLMLLCVAIFLRGGGRCSLDRLVGMDSRESAHDESGDVAAARLFIPGLAGIYRRLAPFSYAFVRVLLCAMLLPSGIDKVFYGGAARIAAGNVLKVGLEPPLAWAWAVGGLEFFGAILLAFGLFTRPIAFALALEMAAITFRVHFEAGFFWTAHGYEFALLLMLVFLAFAIGGGGRYSLDRRIGREF